MSLARAVVYHFKELVRIRAVVFWLLLFPLMLDLIFGAVFSQGSGVKGYVYIDAAPGARGLAERLAKALGRVGFRAVIASGQPPLGLLRREVRRHFTEPIVVLALGGATLERLGACGGGVCSVTLPVYATAAEPAVVAAQVASSVLYSAAAGRRLSVEPRVELLSSFSGPLTALLIVGLFTVLYAMASVAGEIEGFMATRLNKLVAVAPGGPRYYKAVVFAAPLLLALLSLGLMGAVTGGVFGADVGRLYGDPYFWAAVAADYLFAYGLACLIAGVLIRASSGEEQARRLLGDIGPGLPLGLAFLSGYFIPYSLMPAGLRALARLLPTYYALQASLWSLELNMHMARLLLYSLAPSATLAAAGALLLPEVKRI